MNPIRKIFAKSRAAVSDGFSALADLREQIAAIKARIGDIERAPQSVESAMSAFDAWVDRIGTEAIDGLRLDLAAYPEWSGPKLPINVIKHDGFLVRDTVRATDALFGLIAMTGREALRKIVLEQMVDRMRGERGLNDEDRASALADARADLLAAELSEESLVRSIEEVGLSVIRRGDVPGAVLLAHGSALPS